MSFLKRLFKSSEQQPHQKPRFTGTCYVRSHTMDGYYVGRCYHATYDGKCYLHGDVTEWLPENPIDSNSGNNWPKDFDLERS